MQPLSVPRLLFSFKYHKLPKKIRYWHLAALINNMPKTLGRVLPQSSPNVGSLEGRVPPKFSLEDSTPKTLIQYKRKYKDMRKPKLVVGQGEHDDVDFLRQGFLKSSLSSHFLTDRGVSASSHSSSTLLGAPSVVEAAGVV